MDDLTCLSFRNPYPENAFIGSKTPQKIRLGEIFRKGATTEATQKSRIRESLDVSKIDYRITQDTHSNLGAGTAHQEVTWAFYYWCHLNLGVDSRLMEIDRILLNGKTFEEHCLRPVKGRPESVDPPLPFYVPVPIANFVGRKKERKQLHDVLMKEGMHAAVQGWPGVGKTSFAIDYAYHYRNAYAGIWWCRAEGRDDLLSDIQKVAQFLKAPFADESGEQGATACMKHLASLNGPYLLIYDNAEGPQHIDGLMPSSGARLLITSRFSDWNTRAKLIPLDVLPLPEAVAFLQAETGISDAAGAERLAEILGCLPLALDHAAAYCRNTGKFDQYTAQVARLIAERPDHSAYPNSVGATFTMAIDKAVESCPAAEALIAFFAYCAPDRVPVLMLEGAIADQDERTAAVQALRNVSLIKFDPYPDSSLPAWTVHRLVQEVARARSTESRASMLTKIGLHLNRVFPTTGYDLIKDWPVCKALMPHFRQVQAFIETNAGAGDFSTLFNLAGLYLLGNANMKSAGDLLKRSLTIRHSLPSVTPRELAKSISDLSLFLHTDGKLSEALELCKEALAIRVKEFTMKDKDTTISLNNLAYIYMDQNKLVLSDEYFRKSLKFTIEIFGENDLETATAWDNLSNCSRKRGRLDEALEFCEKGVAITLSQCAEDDVALAASFESLASIKYDLNRKDEAYDHYAKAEELCIKYYGTDNFASTKVRMGMVRILIERNEFDKAEEKFALVLTATEKSCGTDDDENARVREQYASMLAKAGKPHEARTLLQKAIQIFQANTLKPSLLQANTSKPSLLQANKSKLSPDARRCKKTLKKLDAGPD